MRHRAALALCLASWLVQPLAAQRAEFAGYALNVFLRAGAGPLNAAGVQDLQRVRLMATGALATLHWDVAYEQLLTLASSPDLASIGRALGQPGGGGDWLPLQGTLADNEHVVWRHRLDRLSIAVAGAVAEMSLGRQTIAWATTLLLTPADPFAPFDPADPFREYRGGVDAARLRVFPSPMSGLEVVVRPATFDSVTTLTALVRGRIAVGRLELGAWGGVLHDAAAGSAGATVTAAGAVLRAETVVRSSEEAGTVVRLAVGADRSFALARRALYVAVEYQRDGFGAADGAGLLDVLGSAPFRRGELQVLGRDEVTLNATWQAHPLVSLSGLALWNGGDGSVLLSPAASYDVLPSANLRVGAYFGFGAETTPVGQPGSEYGVVPVTGYAAGSVYF